ncbi:hypothetical protein [Acinetobacter sp. 226-4]|nr:hypothetical protein [Acinetobacter sp. 226-4]
MPKLSSFEHITQAQIQVIEDNLHHHPKLFGWYTPVKLWLGI